MPQIKFKLLLFALLTISSKSYSQCIRFDPPTTGECCCILSAMPFLAASYRISPHYGLAGNKQLGEGEVIGMEFVWFPMQSFELENEWPLVYALKLAVSSTANYGKTNPKVSAFYETDLYLRHFKNDKQLVFDPYIGIDIGISDGYMEQSRSNFATSYMAGANFNISETFALNLQARHLFVFENPRTEIFWFTFGMQFNFYELFID